jgi:hypothetical protein
MGTVMTDDRAKAEARAREWLVRYLREVSRRRCNERDFFHLDKRAVTDLILSVQEDTHARWRNALIPNNEDTDLGRECLNPEFCAGVLKESEKFTLETKLAERDAEVKRVVAREYAREHNYHHEKCHSWFSDRPCDCGTDDDLVALLRSRDERALQIARDVADGNGTAAEVLRRLEAPDV